MSATDPQSRFGWLNLADDLARLVRTWEHLDRELDDARAGLPGECREHARETAENRRIQVNRAGQVRDLIYRALDLPALVDALRQLVQVTQETMTEAEKMEHTIDAHGEECALCWAREQLERMAKQHDSVNE